jgi:hypothetical protein
MNRTTIKKIAVTGATMAAIALPAVALAQPELGLEYAESIGLPDQDIRTTIGGVIRAFMGLLGIVAVLLILYGGFKWMTAAGNEDQVGEAKKIIISGVIGLIIIMSAYAIATFVIGAIVNGTTG